MLHSEPDAATIRSIELKSKLRKIVTSPEVMDVLNNREFKGEPVWGLSEGERTMVSQNRQKVNES